MAVTVNTVSVHAMKTYWGEEVQLHLFSDSTLDRKFLIIAGKTLAVGTV